MDTFLGRALTDAATGLPNIPYFRIIQNWEERRARRRNTMVRVIRVAAEGGAESLRRAAVLDKPMDGQTLLDRILGTTSAEHAEI